MSEADKWGGLTPNEIAASLRNRANYFRSAEGGWRDDSAALLDTAAACINGLRLKAIGADLWRRELKGLCELIVERAHQEETSTHIVVTIEEPDGNLILTRAERLLHEMQTTRITASLAENEA